MTADELGRRIHYSRTKISRLENVYGRPDVAAVITILNTLEVPEQKRQERLLRPDGPTCEFVIDEVVVRRRTVSRAVMSAQLHHMVKVVAAEPRFTLRVLPMDADMEGALLPKATFALNTFPDPMDPPMAIVDTVTTDLIHTERREVTGYVQRYEDLIRGALAPQNGLALLTETADRLIDKVGPPE